MEYNSSPKDIGISIFHSGNFHSRIDYIVAVYWEFETGLLIRPRNRSNAFRTVLTRIGRETLVAKLFLNYFLKRRRGDRLLNKITKRKTTKNEHVYCYRFLKILFYMVIISIEYSRIVFGQEWSFALEYYYR